LTKILEHKFTHYNLDGSMKWVAIISAVSKKDWGSYAICGCSATWL